MAVSPQCGDVPSLWEILGAILSALAVGQREDFPQYINACFYTFPTHRLPGTGLECHREALLAPGPSPRGNSARISLECLIK